MSASKAPEHRDPPKAADLDSHLHLLVTSIFRILFAYVGAYHLLIEPHRGHKISASQEILAGEIALASTELPCGLDRALPFGRRSEIHPDRGIGQTPVSPPAKPGAYL